MVNDRTLNISHKNNEDMETMAGEWALSYGASGDSLTDAKSIIELARQNAYRSINLAMLQRNWTLGKRISEEILLGESRAEYGDELIKNLSDELTCIYGKGFKKSNLYSYIQFYKIFRTLSGKSEFDRVHNSNKIFQSSIGKL